MASRGSVIPLFVNQIKRKQPITITDPAMTRFMMTLENAVELVVYAFEHGKNGDIFVQKSPASTIADLAQALKELYNARQEIKVIGTRHGEKLFETLVNREEMVKAIDEKDYFRIPADTRDLNYNIFFTEGKTKVAQVEEYNSHNTHRLNVEETKKLLLNLRMIREDVLKEKPERVFEP
jgi:UDP-glucose 4-epimerase